MFKKLAIAVVVLLAGLLAYAAFQPDTFHVERSVDTREPPERIRPFLEDFHRWQAWSPWEKLDPQMQRTFSGPERGRGAVYEWSGNGNAGAGRMEITSSEPQAVAIKLDFLEPFASSNTTAFALQPVGTGTRIRWTIDGPMPYLSKLMCVFVSMDQLIGKDFETGLRQLKDAAENAAVLILREEPAA